MCLSQKLAVLLRLSLLVKITAKWLSLVIMSCDFAWPCCVLPSCFLARSTKEEYWAHCCLLVCQLNLWLQLRVKRFTKKVISGLWMTLKNICLRLDRHGFKPFLPLSLTNFEQFPSVFKIQLPHMSSEANNNVYEISHLKGIACSWYIQDT